MNDNPPISISNSSLRAFACAACAQILYMLGRPLIFLSFDFCCRFHHYNAVYPLGLIMWAPWLIQYRNSIAVNLIGWIKDKILLRIQFPCIHWLNANTTATLHRPIGTIFHVLYCRIEFFRRYYYKSAEALLRIRLIQFSRLYSIPWRPPYYNNTDTVMLLIGRVRRFEFQVLIRRGIKFVSSRHAPYCSLCYCCPCARHTKRSAAFCSSAALKHDSLQLPQYFPRKQIKTIQNCTVWGCWPMSPLSYFECAWLGATWACLGILNGFVGALIMANSHCATCIFATQLFSHSHELFLPLYLITCPMNPFADNASSWLWSIHINEKYNSSINHVRSPRAVRTTNFQWMIPVR